MASKPTEIFAATLQHEAMEPVHALTNYFQRHIIGQDRFKGLDPVLLSEATIDAFKRGLSPEQGSALADHVFKQVNGATKISEFVAGPKSQWAEMGTLAEKQKKLSHSLQLDRPAVSVEQKILGGVSLIAAATSLFSVCGHAKQARTTDEQGVSHTQWSQVGMAVLSAAFAAGLAYVGVQQTRGRMAAF